MNIELTEQQVEELAQMFLIDENVYNQLAGEVLKKHIFNPDNF